MPTRESSGQSSSVTSSTVCGLIVVDQERWTVKTYPEFLILAAKVWFASLRDKYISEATAARQDGDEEFALEMEDLSIEMSRLLSAGKHIKIPGMWPMVNNRAQMQLWDLRTLDEARKYARDIVQFAEPANANDQFDFAFVVTARGALLAVTPPLSTKTRYSSHVVDARVVSRPEFDTLLRRELGA